VLLAAEEIAFQTLAFFFKIEYHTRLFSSTAFFLKGAYTNEK
jgi:hypothetical protein